MQQSKRCLSILYNITGYPFRSVGGNYTFGFRLDIVFWQVCFIPKIMTISFLAGRYLKFPVAKKAKVRAAVNILVYNQFQRDAK